MRDYFDQVRHAGQTHLYFLALFGALTIPDMCAGMDAPTGVTTGPLYRAWFDRWVAPSYTAGGAPSFTGNDCWGLRCAALHQGRLEPHGGSYKRVIFVEPGAIPGGVLHNNVLDDALNIDVPTFVNDMVNAATTWLTSAEQTPLYRANYSHFMQRHPSGLEPFISGIPVIG